MLEYAGLLTGSALHSVLRPLIVNVFLLVWATGVLAAERDVSAFSDLRREYGGDSLGQYGQATVRVGHRHKLLRWLEAKLSTAMRGNRRTAKVQVQIPYVAATLAKVNMLPLAGRKFGIYGLAGYVNSKPSLSYLGKPVTKGEYGLSFGAGIELLDDERNGFSLELVRHVEESFGAQRENVDRIGVGYVRRF